MTVREKKHLLELLGIKQKELAAKIPCSTVELSQTISGKRINPHIRKRMAEVLCIPVERLFGTDHEASIEKKAKRVAA